MPAQSSEYTLTFEERPNYLYAHIRADHISPELVEAYVREMHDMCVKDSQTHLLVRRDIPEVFPVGSYFGVSANTVAVLHGIRTAWLTPYPQHQDRLEFACLVANNRGAMYRVFLDLAEAEKWLGRVPRHEILASPRLSTI
ncbi:MAG: hypothetical protein JO314_11390 [Acidobacteria bacterium]|nr:hypothetical protein [Acidobacteriota bacterium]